MRRALADVVFAIALGCGSTIMWWSFYPYNVGAVQSEPFQVMTPEVRAGGTLIVRGWACKWMDVPGTVYRRYVDGVVYNAPGVLMSLRTGCRGADEDLRMHVPNLPAGVYHIEAEMHFPVNPIRVMRYHYQSQPFTVVATKEP